MARKGALANFSRSEEERGMYSLACILVGILSSLARFSFSKPLENRSCRSFLMQTLSSLKK